MRVWSVRMRSVVVRRLRLRLGRVGVRVVAVRIVTMWRRGHDCRNQEEDDDEQQPSVCHRDRGLRTFQAFVTSFAPSFHCKCQW